MEHLLSNLEEKKKQIITVGKTMIESTNSIHGFDMYCSAQLNRSLNIVDGYIDLARKDNFIAAFPLVRIHLDTLQRIFAFQLIDKNIDEVFLEIMSGKQIKNYVNKNNNRKLTDAELNEQLSLFFREEWVKNIYKAGNSFVHFSDKHILSSTQTKKEDQFKFKSVIYHGSPFIANDEKEGATIYMEKITDGILYFINCWIEQKKSCN